MDGFPFGLFVFVDYSKNHSFFQFLQTLKYEVELGVLCIYAYDSAEFYEMLAMSSGVSETYVISEINVAGARYRKLL